MTKKVRAFELIQGKQPLLTQQGLELWREFRDRYGNNRDMHLADHAACKRGEDAPDSSDMQREAMLANRQYKVAAAVIDQHLLVEPAADIAFVDMHTVVTISIDGKEPKRIWIVDHGLDNPMTHPPQMSYSSRLALRLMGRKVGEEIEIPLDRGAVTFVEILDISLPTATCVLQMAA